MFITKKKHAAIVASLNADLKTAHEWMEEMRKQRDAAQKLQGVLDKLADKVNLMTPGCIGSSYLTCATINGIKIDDSIARFVPDHFGGQVLIQEATKVIEISVDGGITTGLTKRKADDGYGYVLVLNRRDAK